MAVNLRNLSVLAYANGFTHWHYKTGQDTLREIMAPGYFNPGEDMFAVGDVIIAVGRDGGRNVLVTDITTGMVRTGPLS